MADPTPRDRIKRRLGFIVYAIDAGTYYEPEDAADEILGVLESIHPSHRDDLIAWVRTELPEVQEALPLPGEAPDA